jgi:FtsH-binding integral membrane protein
LEVQKMAEPVPYSRTAPGKAGTPYGVTADTDRVLRNTYWLLALSMVPTIAGAWLGVATGFARALTPGSD